MAQNPKDAGVETEVLQLEASNGATEERMKEILSEIVVRTIRQWQKPDWFTHWVSTTDKDEAEAFLNKTLDTLLDLELFEFCNHVELLKDQLEIFHSMKRR